ncbi:MAG: hypothetical protein AAGH72_11185 [Verrucomicrobiota bacterium]
MTQTILYRDRKYTVYGWKIISGEFLFRQAIFTSPITFEPGEKITLDESSEVFRISSVDTNTHKAEFLETGTLKTPVAAV